LSNSRTAVCSLYVFTHYLDLNSFPTRRSSDLVENIDIGGPTMLRAAAKNYQDVTVIVDPEDYDGALTLLKKDELTEEQRKQFAAKVFRHTAHYDGMIANYFTEET